MFDFSHPILSPEDERRLAILSRDGDTEARNTLITHNVRLVASIASNYSHISEFADLMAEGMMGLMVAVDSYDPDRAKLSTHARSWIMSRMQRYIRRDTTVRSPQKVPNPVMVEWVEDRDARQIPIRHSPDIDVSTLLAVLDDRERMLVTMYYDLDRSGVRTTYAGLGRMVGLSHEGVRLALERAIRKMRSTIETPPPTGQSCRDLSVARCKPTVFSRG